MSELPKGWVLTTIGEVLQPQFDGKLIHQGWSPRCQAEPAGIGEWGVLKTTAIQDGYFLEIHNKKLQSHMEPKPEIEVRKGDLLMTNAGPRVRCGVTTLVKEDIRSKLMLSGKMYRMRFDESCIYPPYIEACFRSDAVKKEIDNRKTGMSESGLNLTQERFLSIPILLCPYPEQKRIADKLDFILTKVDRAQARLGKIPGILKRFRQSVLVAATSGELTKEWRGGAEHNWQTVSLGTVGKGFNYGSSTKSQPEGDVPVLRMGNLQGGQLDWGDLVYTSDKAEIEKYLLENGDVLFNRTNSPELVGKTSIYRGERKAIYAGYLIRVKGSERLNTEFLNIQLNSPHARDYCWQVKTDGVSQSNINAKKLQAYEFDLPAIDEQLEIVRRVNELFSHAALFERQYLDAKRRFDRLTQAVLAKAFRGELVEQNAADEPADKLLERIKQQQLDAPKLVKKPRNTSKRAKNPAVHSAEPSAELEQPQSDLLLLLKNSKGELTVQQIIDQLSEKTFEQVDALFTELKWLLDSNLIIKVGAGEACAFKAVKR
uniref:restriction endonuclease subunit S n=1 Tax=Rheinheimera sp. TaxID=1869214 RepID=UPI00404822A6